MKNPNIPPIKNPNIAPNISQPRFEFFFLSVQIYDWCFFAGWFELGRFAIPTIVEIGGGVYEQFIDERDGAVDGVDAMKSLTDDHRQMRVGMDVYIRVHDRCHACQAVRFRAFAATASAAVQRVNCVSDLSFVYVRRSLAETQEQQRGGRRLSMRQSELSREQRREVDSFVFVCPVFVVAVIKAQYAVFDRFENFDRLLQLFHRAERLRVRVADARLGRVVQDVSVQNAIRVRRVFHIFDALQ